MSLLVRMGIAERVGVDVPSSIRELIDRLAESEDDVVIRRDVPRATRDPLVYVKGRPVGAWLDT